MTNLKSLSQISCDFTSSNQVEIYGPFSTLSQTTMCLACQKEIDLTIYSPQLPMPRQATIMQLDTARKQQLILQLIISQDHTDVGTASLTENSVQQIPHNYTIQAFKRSP